MLRFLSIRSRLMFLTLLLVASLIVTNLVLIRQTRIQSDLIDQQARNIDVIVTADAAVHTFGNLKYWLTDRAVSQLILSEQRAKASFERLEKELETLAQALPGSTEGVAEQLDRLVTSAETAAEAYGRGDRLIGNSMLARGRAHILAVDSRLASVVSAVRAQARSTAAAALRQSGREIQVSLLVVALVTVAAIVLTILVVRSVVGPLRQLMRAMNAMSAGQMNVRIPTAGRDEVGRMAQVLSLFRDSVVGREKAERTEARLRQVIENISDGFALFDADDRLVLSNRQYREGMQREGLQSDQESLFSPGTPFEAILRATAKGGLIRQDSLDLETWISQRLDDHRDPSHPLVQQRRDGSWVQINEHKTVDGGTVIIYTDITTLKRREEELAEQADVLRGTLRTLRRQALTLEQLYDAVIVVDLNNHIIDWNTAAERVFGYTRAEMLGRTTACLYVNDEEAHRLQGEMAEAMERGERWVGECDNRRKDGSLVYIEAVVFRLFDEDGNAVSTIGVSRDITERKQAEDALRESQQTLRAVIDTLPAIVNVKDREGHFTLANPAQAAFYGLAPQDLLGKTLFEIADAEYAKRTQEKDQAVLETGAPIAGFDDPAKDVDGNLTTWFSTKVPLFGPGQQVTGVLTVAQDITLRKKAELALQQAKDEAELATRAKSQFLANMSHELRTPLNAIIGFSRLVIRRSKDTLEKRQFENMGKILASAEHLLALINDILDLSKIESGQVELRKTEVDLTPLIDQCLRNIEPLAASKALTLSRDSVEALPPIRTDPDKLKQILINLLSNAAKFTDKGRITVHGERRGSRIALSVIDTGIGIPKWEQESIFEAFHQLDSSTTRKYGGTGLGLSISRHLAQLIGGEIAVESAPGEGSRFVLTLPYDLADSIPKAAN